MMQFEKATGAKRESLALLRAGAWSGEATPEQFVERNRLVYQHPYGQRKIDTFLLRDDSGQIISSMDSLSISLYVNRAISTVPIEEEGFLIASVITPIEFRKKGCASLMLKKYFETESRSCGILYSDVGPEFYERYGFTENMGWLVQRKTEEQALAFSGCSIGLDEFCNSLNRYRIEKLKQEGIGAACLVADTLFLDWQLVRFRYFAEIKKKKLPVDLCFKVIHGNAAHNLFMVPNELSGKAEVFWKEPDCKECLRFIILKAFQWGMGHVVYWEFVPGPDAIKQECPMIRISNVSEAYFCDPQLCDWW